MGVTIQRIAELTGVSRGTVDRVLNNRGRVSEDVEIRVRRIAEELGYVTRTERKARRLSGVPIKKIGVVTQLSRANFMVSVKKGLESAAMEADLAGMEVIIKECPDVDEAQQCAALDELEEAGIDALAIMPVECDSVRERIRKMIRERDVKVVTFNTDIVGTKRLAFVGMDNRQGGRTAAGLLGTLMRGRGSALAVIGNFSNSTSLLRIDGFTDELARSFPSISIAGVSPSLDSEKEVENIIKNALVTYPDLGGILMISSGQLGIKRALEAPEVIEALRKRKDKRRPYIIVYDLTPRNRKLLQNDIVDFVIDQDGYSQGYRSVMTLVSLLGRGVGPAEEFLYTDITIRTKYTSP